MNSMLLLLSAVASTKVKDRIAGDYSLSIFMHDQQNILHVPCFKSELSLVA